MDGTTLTGKITWHGARSGSSCHVSNGEHIVRVDDRDRYALPYQPGRHRLIFVIPPGDSVCRGKFWRVCGKDGGPPADTDFTLKSIQPLSDRGPTVLHVTDLHLRAHRPAPRYVAFYKFGVGGKPLRDTPRTSKLRRALMSLIEAAGPVDFIVATGDITDMGEPAALRSAARLFASLPVPVYPIFGGHDGNAERADAERVRGYRACHFTAHLAPPYYAWNFGGVHFISFVSETDFLDPQTEAMQQAFVAEDLKRFGSSQPVMVCAHKHPYPWDVGPFRAPGVRVHGWLHGHFHCGRVYDHDGIRVFCTGPTGMGGFDQTRVQARVIEAAVRDKPTSRPITLTNRAARSTGRRTRSQIQLVWRSAPGDTFAPLAAPCSTDEAVYCGLVDDEAGRRGGVVAFDHDGRELWRTSCDGSLTAPIVVGNNRLIAVSQTGRVACLSRDIGDIIWTHESPDIFDRWVYAPPLMLDDTVVVGTTSLLTRLNLSDGTIIWQHRDKRTSTDAFCQLQGPADHDGRLFLPGYGTPSYQFNAATGEVVHAGDDRNVRYASRHAVVEASYLIGDMIGGLHRFDLSTGRPYWMAAVSQCPITSGAAEYRDSVIVGVSEGIGRYATADGAKLAFHRFGRNLGLDVPNQTESRGCPGTPCVEGDRVWAASSDGYLNVLDARTLRPVDRLPLDAPWLSPIRRGPGGRVYGVDSTGRLLCLRSGAPTHD